MSKSPPRDLCWTAKLTHDKELGGSYRITDRDMVEAKRFLIAGGGEMPDPDTLVSYMKKYLERDYVGWREQNYPLSCFFRNWNAFAPKKKRKAEPMKFCDIHEVGYHGERCPKCFTPVEQ